MILDIVQPPVIMSTNRNSQNTAATVHFTVPPSEDNADYFVVSYYNHTELTFNPVSYNYYKYHRVINNYDLDRIVQHYYHYRTIQLH